MDSLPQEKGCESAPPASWPRPDSSWLWAAESRCGHGLRRPEKDPAVNSPPEALKQKDGVALPHPRRTGMGETAHTSGSWTQSSRGSSSCQGRPDWKAGRVRASLLCSPSWLPGDPRFGWWGEGRNEDAVGDNRSEQIPPRSRRSQGDPWGPQRAELGHPNTCRGGAVARCQDVSPGQRRRPSGCARHNYRLPVW